MPPAGTEGGVGVVEVWVGGLQQRNPFRGGGGPFIPSAFMQDSARGKKAQRVTPAA